MSMKRSIAGAFVALAVMFIAISGSATVLEELTLEEMTARADGIVHGVVATTGSRLVFTEHQGVEPHTITTIRVLRWLKGGDAPSVTIRERGGVVQDREMWFSGTPRYAVNEEVVIFLERRAERANEFRTFGMITGKFQVRHGIGDVPSSVSRDLDGVGFARWADDGTMSVGQAQPEPSMHLESFLIYVEGLVGRGTR
jgi:hypothetical protein